MRAPEARKCGVLMHDNAVWELLCEFVIRLLCEFAIHHRVYLACQIVLLERDDETFFSDSIFLD